MRADPVEARQHLPTEWVRGQFPALSGPTALLDNAGGSAPLAAVCDRVAEYMRRWPVQLGASYRESALAAERLAQARRELATMLGAPAGRPVADDEIVVGASSSSLISRLARSLAPGLRRGDRIVVTDADHEANISPWRRLQDHGVDVAVWSLNMDTHRLEPEDLRALLSERTRLVCFTHASNILGEAMPVRRIADMVHDCGGKVCVDGVAYAPHRPIDVRGWDVDFYAFSLYKVYGPHCAVLFCKAEAMEGLANLNHQFMDGQAGPGKLELGAFPYELLYGAAAVPTYLRALSEHLDGRACPSGFASAYDAMAAQEHELSSRLLAFLDSKRSVTIAGTRQPGPDRLPTISFTVAGRSSSTIPPVCDSHGVGIRWGHFYAPRLIERLGLTEQDGVVRISMVHYNTADEVDRLIRVLDPLLEATVT